MGTRSARRRQIQLSSGGLSARARERARMGVQNPSRIQNALWRIREKGDWKAASAGRGNGNWRISSVFRSRAEVQVLERARCEAEAGAAAFVPRRVAPHRVLHVLDVSQAVAG